jgi:hypothetical protein
MITENRTIGGNTLILVRHIHNLLALDLQVQIHHIWREENKSAD